MRGAAETARSNAGPDATLFEDDATTFYYFDRLPAILRQLFAHAPFDYGMKPWFEEYAQKRGVYSDEHIAYVWAKNMVKWRARAALELYGPDHPQAPRP